jgi:hypothetical protein
VTPQNNVTAAPIFDLLCALRRPLKIPVLHQNHALFSGLFFRLKAAQGPTGHMPSQNNHNWKTMLIPFAPNTVGLQRRPCHVKEDQNA